ncbi:hypothetical protein [Lentzea waywayandensis]|uniref:hypothetical protein n=1 Tax=Lentzea waywayandensis TaxID=84724 RepID=UPI000B80C3DA|nr:hypothetical protein [Lentzea waywayandensis]
MLAGGTLALTVVAGAAPASGAWLTMLLVDELTSGEAGAGRAAFLASRRRSSVTSPSRCSTSAGISARW